MTEKQVLTVRMTQTVAELKRIKAEHEQISERIDCLVSDLLKCRDQLKELK